jgi:homoserine dehydrogenase
MSDALTLAIAGLGTGGVGTLQLLETHRDLLQARCGRSLQVVAVSARDKNRDRGVKLDGFDWYDDPVEMARESKADVVLELIGGSDGPARETCEVALDGGKHVVTANKALVALHGGDLARRAESAGVALSYEAAVAGGIPIIKALREGLAANGVSSLHGILNGTCNYILTTMRETGRPFEDVLSEAQSLGYAEADPSFDIDGVDAAHKLAILTSVAFGCEVNFDGVHIEGIRHVAAEDIAYATELGYRIKLLGLTDRTESGVLQRVYPAMVPLDAPIAGVEGVFNGVVAEGDFVGPTMYEGRGAGAGPTASAVVADVVDIACGRNTATFGVPVDLLSKTPSLSLNERVGLYYVRLMVEDSTGVFADIATTLRDAGISIESAMQRTRSDSGVVPVVLTTHETREAEMSAALESLAKLKSVAETPRMIRIESL